MQGHILLSFLCVDHVLGQVVTIATYSLVLSFRLGAVMCMGVTAGAYILTLFAVCSLLQ